MVGKLAPVYLDDTRVTLRGDPRPQVRKILSMGGKPGDHKVLRLRQVTDHEGKPLKPTDVVDRTLDSHPVYLRCIDASDPATARTRPSRPSKNKKAQQAQGPAKRDVQETAEVRGGEAVGPSSPASTPGAGGAAEPDYAPAGLDATQVGNRTGRGANPNQTSGHRSTLP